MSFQIWQQKLQGQTYFPKYYAYVYVKYTRFKSDILTTVDGYQFSNLLWFSTYFELCYTVSFC